MPTRDSAVRQKTLSLGPEFMDLKLAYLEWGEPGAARTVVCVHGLTRNAHDFDVIGAALAEHDYRVLAVDVAGRGGSDWLADPAQYEMPLYAAQLRRLLGLLDLPAVDWIGTSMGGLIGIVLAGGDRSPITRLVVNDIGPFVANATLAQIRGYLGLDLAFKDLAEVEAHLRLIHAPFGQLADEQWQTLAFHGSRKVEDGFRLHYDPAIREPFFAAAEVDIDLWRFWDRIRCPVLVLHGAESVLLTADILDQMQQRGPPIHVVTLPGVGHAPALMAADQIQIVQRWLAL
jgi:pimeloyl-ACP methyl ester carboxylesterase